MERRAPFVGAARVRPACTLRRWHAYLILHGRYLADELTNEIMMRLEECGVAMAIGRYDYPALLLLGDAA